jgi:tRNA(fMet)-specific endonuclease VapC
MPQFLFDTDHLTLFERNHPPILQQLQLQPKNAVAVSAVTVEESLRGRLAALARCRNAQDRINSYGQLLATIQVFSRLPLISWEQASEAEFQRLRSMRVRVGTQDLKISAIALANNFTLLTRNRVDFSRIPGLKISDWSI